MQATYYQSLGIAAALWGWQTGGLVPAVTFRVRDEESGGGPPRGGGVPPAPLPGTRGLVRPPGGEDEGRVASRDRVLADAVTAPRQAGGYRGLRVLVERWLEDERSDPGELVSLLELPHRAAPFHRLGFLLARIAEDREDLRSRAEPLLAECRRRRGRGRVKLVPRGGASSGPFDADWRVVVNDPAARQEWERAREGTARTAAVAREGAACREVAVPWEAAAPVPVQELLPPDPVQGLTHEKLALWAGRDRRSFDRFCADLCELEARALGGCRQLVFPEETDRADRGIDGLVELDPAAPEGEILGPGLNVVQVKCRDPRRGLPVLVPELRRAARDSLERAIRHLGAFRRFVLVTNVPLPEKDRKKIEQVLAEAAAGLVREHAPGAQGVPAVRVVGASHLARLVRARWPQLAGHLGVEPRLVPWRRRLAHLHLRLERTGRTILLPFRGREQEVGQLRRRLGIEGPARGDERVVLVAPREAGATRLALEALRPVASRSFWWEGGDREGRPRLESILAAAGGADLWVVLDRPGVSAAELESWIGLADRFPGTRLLVIESRPPGVGGVEVLEIQGLGHEVMEELVDEVAVALGCDGWGPGEGFRWRRALAGVSGDRPGRLVRLARRLDQSDDPAERREALRSAGFDEPPPDLGDRMRDLSRREQDLLSLVALVGAVRLGSPWAGSPPPEFLAVSGVARLDPRDAGAILRRLAEDRAGLRPAPGGVEADRAFRDALVQQALRDRPDLVEAALRHPVLRVRAAEGLGRLRGSPEARRLAQVVLRPLGRPGRDDLPDAGEAAVLAALAVLVPDLVVRVLRQRTGKASLAELAGDARRRTVEALEEALRIPEGAPGALSLLESLAREENESWANNATGIFRGAFDPGNVFVALSLRERADHLARGVARAVKETDAPRLRLLLETIPGVFGHRIGGWFLPGERHRLPDLAPLPSARDLRQYLERVLGTWEEAIEGGVGLLGREEATRTFRDHLPDVLLAAAAHGSKALAVKACAMVERLAAGADEWAWLGAIERWRQVREGWDPPPTGRRVLKVIDEKLRGIRRALLGGDERRLPPARAIRRWLGPLVPLEDVGTGRDPRPRRLARRLARQYSRRREILDEADLEWLLSAEAQHGHLFWRALGKEQGAEEGTRAWLLRRLRSPRGAEALGAWLAGVAEKDPRAALRVTDEIREAVLADAEDGSRGERFLDVLFHRGLEHVRPEDLLAVLRAVPPVSRRVRLLFAHPRVVEALSRLAPGELARLSTRFPGKERATIRLSFLEALVRRPEDAPRGTEVDRERIALAWRIAESLPGGVAEQDRWRWRRVLGQLAEANPEGFVRFVERLAPPRGDVREWMALADDVAEVAGRLAGGRARVPGLARALLDAFRDGRLGACGVLDLPCRLDPARDGEEILAWVLDREGDRDAWLLAARAIDLERPEGLHLAVRLVESCRDPERQDLVIDEICGGAMSASGLLADIRDRYRQLADRGEELAERGTSAAARKLGACLRDRLRQELRETAERFHDAWLDWDGTLAIASKERLADLPPDDSARRRYVVRVLESYRDEEVLARVTEEDIRRAVESGGLRDEVAARWRSWLARREEGRR